MAEGRPDFQQAIILRGWDGSQHRDIVCDTNGNLYALLKGYTGSLYVPLKVDAAGQLFTLLQGYDGVAYRPVKVDDAGNMLAVMKGDYGGVLKTVGLDDAGRITVFLADAQDVWGNIVNVGNAELAARLGSPKVYDRRGDVLLVENFDKGINAWTHSAAGATTGWFLSTQTARIGGYSAKCVTAATSGLSYTLSRGLSAIALQKLGLEVSFSLATDTDFNLQFGAWLYRGSSVSKPMVTYDSINARWGYRDTNGSTQWLAPTMPFYVDEKTFYTARLVWDLDALLYDKLLVSSTEYDLSAYALDTDADATAPYYYLFVTLTTAAAEATTLYVDSVIPTQNEP